MKRRVKPVAGRVEAVPVPPSESPGPSPRKTPKTKSKPIRLPAEEVLHDGEGRKWLIGEVLGEGTEDPIYIVSSPKLSGDYVVKIEPYAHLSKGFDFYRRAAKKKDVDLWLKRHRLSHVGVPVLMGSGLHSLEDKKHCFLVLPRLGPDLQTLIDNGTLSLLCKKTVFWLGIQLLNCLEYLHDHEYTHGDVKASSIVLGYKEGHIDDNRIYLVNYGLSHRYRVVDEHKSCKEMQGLAPEGSVIFLSRDAHKGIALSRRGDLETLGYCLLQWLCGRLPWEDKLTDKDYVRDSKIKHMNDISSFVNECITDDSGVVEAMIEYLEHVNKLQYDEKPDYDLLRKSFLSQVDANWIPELLSRKDAVAQTAQPLGKHQILSSNRGRSRITSLPPTSQPSNSKAITKREFTPSKVIKKQTGAKRCPSKPLADTSGATPDETETQKKVTLNIGGMLFTTFLSTLQKHPSKLLEKAGKQELEEELFFDRDGTYFAYILNFLRDEQTTLPDTKLELQRVYDESVYYGLRALTDRINEELLEME